jgi:hypothetical protein
VRFRLTILLHLFFLAFQFVAQINRRQVCREAERRRELNERARFLLSRNGSGWRSASGKMAANGDLASSEAATFLEGSAFALPKNFSREHYNLHSKLRTCNNCLKPGAQ